MTGITFYIGLALLLLHEGDAKRCKEWRILPGLSLLKDKTGFIVFTAVHIPVFIWLFWRLTNGEDLEAFKMGFDIFFMLHFGAHLLFLKHPKNEFKGWGSWVIISGAGICGLIDLLNII